MCLPVFVFCPSRWADTQRSPPQLALAQLLGDEMSSPWRSNISAGEGPLPARDLFPDDAWTAKLAVAPVRCRCAACASAARAARSHSVAWRGAQGTVYGNRWEQMATNAAALRVGDATDYAPPFARGPASNPVCYLGIRAGGVSLGRVVLELRADCAPLAAENFRALCEFGVYKGAIFHRIFPDFIVQARPRAARLQPLAS